MAYTSHIHQNLYTIPILRYQGNYLSRAMHIYTMTFLQNAEKIKQK